MGDILNPVIEDSFISTEDLAEYAGDIAMQIYKIELDKGNKPSNAVSKAIKSLLPNSINQQRVDDDLFYVKDHQIDFVKNC